MQVDLETAVSLFQELARTLQARPTLPARTVFDRAGDFYREVHVTSDLSDADDREDSLVLTCGSTLHHISDDLIDMRKSWRAAAGGVQLESVTRRYIELERWIAFGPVPKDDGSTNESAITLSVTLIFDPSPFERPCISQRFESMSELEWKLPIIRDAQPVKQLLNAALPHVSATIAYLT